MKRPHLIAALVYYSSQAVAEVDYFSMSPAELAATIVNIATEPCFSLPL